MARAFPSVVIENLQPLIDGGRYPIKRIVGEDLVVDADIFKDGHDVVAAILKWRVLGKRAWRETPMNFVDNDRWRGVCALYDEDIHEYTVEAWTDTFRSWQAEFAKKFEAGISDLRSEALEGAALVEAAARRARDRADRKRLSEFSQQISTGANSEIHAIAQSGELEVLMATYPDRAAATQYDPAPRVVVDRAAALIGAWYEFFPRSAEGRGDRGSKLRDCLPRIDDARAMGFDVIYFPPVHPIGVTARKGKNNAVACQPGEPGVPYAIGNRHQNCPNGGGHKDVAPELGTLEDFDWLVKEIHARGMELALDFALNCSPDHPYVHDHPDWFYKRPDGTIKYAENPPKKYQDVYPLNYHNADWRTLWDELTSVIEFWCEHGVRIFRVDNPHTKPVAFWEYLIARVQKRFPDTIFLSEAFTRSKMMKSLAKAGFTHSYTYFTWRNTKQGLTEYFTELTQTECAEYMRPNLWPNTPDILPSFLQFGGRAAFLIRGVLAATLSPVYGIYSGFELCENAGLEKKPFDAASDVRHFLHLCDNDYKQLAKEEYLDSEKYQWKERDWDAPGNIKPWVTRLNAIRRENRALHEFSNLRFGQADNDLVLYYSKMTAARDNIVMVIVSLDPFHAQDAYIDVPVEQFGWLEG